MLHYLFVYCILIAYINLQKAPSTMTPISVLAYNVVGALISFFTISLVSVSFINCDHLLQFPFHQ